MLNSIYTGSHYTHDLPYYSSTVLGNGHLTLLDHEPQIPIDQEIELEDEPFELLEEDEIAGRAILEMFSAVPGHFVLELPYSHDINIDDFYLGFSALEEWGATPSQIKDYSKAAYVLLLSHEPINELTDICQVLILDGASENDFTSQIDSYVRSKVGDYEIACVVNGDSRRIELLNGAGEATFVDSTEIEEEDHDEKPDWTREFKDQLANSLIKQGLVAALKLLFG